MNNKSIQILRTKLNNTDTKIANEVLLDGQPFYNKTSNKLYVGDGTKKISELNYVGEEVDKDLETKLTSEISRSTTFDNSHNNIENSKGTSSTQIKQDGTGGTWNFSPKNPNITVEDNALTGTMTYGATGNFASSFGGKSTAMGKRSFTKGSSTIAYGNYSSAEGSDTVTMGSASHGEGYANLTGKNADSAHAEGGENYVSAARGHVEGYKNTVTANNAHAEGAQCVASAEEGHAEGLGTTASGMASHSEGQETVASGINAHAEGSASIASGITSHAEGYGNISNSYSAHSEGAGNKILNTLPESGGDTPGPSPVDPSDPNFKIDEHIGYNSHIEGSQNLGYGYTSHTEGANNINYSHYGHAEGTNNILGSVNLLTKKVTGEGIHAEGSQNNSDGYYSHIEGYSNKNNSSVTHIEGYNNKSTILATSQEDFISGHIEGTDNTISGSSRSFHIEGKQIDVQGTANYSHTEGYLNKVKGTSQSSHVEGYNNSLTNGNNCHLGGMSNILTNATGTFVWGSENTVSGVYSTVLGRGLKSSDDSTFHLGTFNNPMPGTGVMGTIGCGSSNSDRRNSLVFMRDGRVQSIVAPADKQDLVRLQELKYQNIVNLDSLSIRRLNDNTTETLRYYETTYGQSSIQILYKGNTSYEVVSRIIKIPQIDGLQPTRNNTLAIREDSWQIYKSDINGANLKSQIANLISEYSTSYFRIVIEDKQGGIGWQNYAGWDFAGSVSGQVRFVGQGNVSYGQLEFPSGKNYLHCIITEYPSSITVNNSEASWTGQSGGRTFLYGKWKLNYFIPSPTNSAIVSMVYHRDYYNDGDTIISDDPTRNTYNADDRFTIEILYS